MNLENRDSKFLPFHAINSWNKNLVKNQKSLLAFAFMEESETDWSCSARAMSMVPMLDQSLLTWNQKCHLRMEPPMFCGTLESSWLITKEMSSNDMAARRNQWRWRQTLKPCWRNEMVKKLLTNLSKKIRNMHVWAIKIRTFSSRWYDAPLYISYLGYLWNDNAAVLNENWLLVTSCRVWK